MTKSNSREEDKEIPSRVDKVHGGEIVEAVSPDELESFNDADCKHEKLVRDESETDFKAFMCANPLCNEVMLYDKDS
jgi:hypothetical protein